jgi:hypothetical protein
MGHLGMLSDGSVKNGAGAAAWVITSLSNDISSGISRHAATGTETSMDSH